MSLETRQWAFSLVGNFAAFARRGVADMIAAVAEQPSNHSPFSAPVVEPTLTTVVAALVAAARMWLRCRRKRVLLTASGAAMVRT
jgi:hypothetical protein